MASNSTAPVVDTLGQLHADLAACHQNLRCASAALNTGDIEAGTGLVERCAAEQLQIVDRLDALQVKQFQAQLADA